MRICFTIMLITFLSTSAFAKELDLKKYFVRQGPEFIRPKNWKDISVITDKELKSSDVLSWSELWAGAGIDSLNIKNLDFVLSSVDASEAQFFADVEYKVDPVPLIIAITGVVRIVHVQDGKLKLEIVGYDGTQGMGTMVRSAWLAEKVDEMVLADGSILDEKTTKFLSDLVEPSLAKALRLNSQEIISIIQGVVIQSPP